MIKDKTCQKLFRKISKLLAESTRNMKSFNFSRNSRHQTKNVLTSMIDIISYFEGRKPQTQL